MSTGNTRPRARKSRAGVGSATVLLLAAGFAWHRAALAGDYPSSSFCPLSRTPILLSGAMSEDLKCTYDEDGNGLDDDMEEKLAACFAPEYHFAPQENALRADEPNVLFNAVRVPPQSVPHSAALGLNEADIVLRMRFVALFARDGGFVLDDNYDSHDGDAPGLIVYVRLIRGIRWYGVPVAFGTLNWNDPKEDSRWATLPPIPGEPIMRLSADRGTNPVVYPSAGKHHMYHHPGTYLFPMNMTSDRYDVAADGPEVRTPIPRHVGWFYQVPYASQSTVIWTATARRMPDGSTMANACTLARTGQLVAAAGIHGNDLSDLGYPGATITGATFLSSTVDGVASVMKVPVEAMLDIDGDGQGEIDATYHVPNQHDPGVTEVAFVATDPCPFGADLTDADEDGIPGRCDPEPLFKNEFVAGGSDATPSARDDYSFSSWTSYDGTRTGLRGGFLDSDRDNSPEGEDSCPARSGGSGIRGGNHWAESTNWPASGWVTTRKNDTLGIFFRGGACDPYPFSQPRWMTADPAAPSGGGSLCELPGWKATGSDAMSIYGPTSAGVSENDSRLDAPPWQWPSKFPSQSYQAQTYRCACMDDQGVPLPRSACFDAPQSDCNRHAALPNSDYSPVTSGRGWRPIDRPGCSRDDHSFCTAYTTAAGPYLDASPDSQQLLWDWRGELQNDLTPPAGWLSHLNHGFFSYDPGSADPIFGREPSFRSAYDYAIWTQMGVDPGFIAPGPLATRSTALLELPDPEWFTPTMSPQSPSHLGPNADENSRRLRAGYAAELRSLVSRHRWFSEGNGCPQFDIKYLVHVRWPETFTQWPEAANPGEVILLAVQGPKLTDQYVFRPARGTFRAVSPGTYAGQSWVAESDGLGVPLLWAASVPGRAALPADELIGGTGDPAILWLERSEAGRWAILAPTGPGGDSVGHEIVAEGALGHPVTDTARLIGDDAGQTAVLVDAADGTAVGFDPVLRTWVNARVPAEALAGRVGAAFALSGSTLAIAGGDMGAGPTGEVWLLDIFGGAARGFGTLLPARSAARLTRSTDGDALLFVGGVDGQGAKHDDVWSVPLAPDAIVSTARLVKADTASASQWDGARTIVIGDAAGADMRAYAAVPAEAGGLVTRVRTSWGWTQLDDSGLPAVTSCDTSDLLGGELCAAQPSWWAAPGIRSCATSPQPGACQGSGGSLTGIATLSASGAAADAAVRGDQLWILTSSKLELWTVQSGLAVQRVAQAVLASHGRALSVESGRVLVASDAGVQLATVSGTSIRMTQPLEVCGRVVGAESLGDGRWAVSTTVGLALVSADDGGVLKLESVSLLVPAGPNGKLLRLSLAATGLRACRMADRLIDGPGLALALRSSGLVKAGQNRLLAARGMHLFDIDVSDPAAPATRALLQTHAALRSLRADSDHGRAYGVGTRGNATRLPVFDLRGDALEARGEHDLASWVSRSDNERFAVRIDAGGTVTLAEVAQ